MVGLLLLFLVIGLSQRGNKRRSRSSSDAYVTPMYTDSSNSWRDDDDRNKFHNDNRDDRGHDSSSDSGSDSGGDSAGGDGGGGGGE
jgi:hypothetical protein